MIDIACACGQPNSADESAVGQAFICPNCQAVTNIVCAETLDAGAGAADFDAVLTVEAGPSRQGESFALGGVAEIPVGKQSSFIQFLGTRVSRHHCTLRRIDFGPSRWQIVDNNSTNGLFVNGARVSEAELSPGDELQIGEYRLRYTVTAPVAAVPAAMAAVSAAAPSLPLPSLPQAPNALPKRGIPAPAARSGKKTNDGWSADETPFNKAGIYIVMIPTILASLFASRFIDVEIPIAPLVAIVAIVGAVGGIVNIYGRGPIWAGALTGLVMALGGFSVVAAWAAHRDRLYKGEIAIAFVVGAAPGFGLQWLLQRLFKPSTT